MEECSDDAADYLQGHREGCPSGYPLFLCDCGARCNRGTKSAIRRGGGLTCEVWNTEIWVRRKFGAHS